MMRIVISNDDGVLAPGLSILAEELAKIAKVEVIAPDRNLSGASNSLTISKPLHVKKLANGYYSVDGTPTDCVHLALKGYFDSDFDLVVSGINEGPNLGDDVLYSGTVAAAIEGRYLGLPAIAVSMVGTEIKHYATAAIMIKNLILNLNTNSFNLQTVLNINVPDVPIEKIKGIAVTRLGKRHASEPVIKEKDPRNRAIFWIGPPGAEADSGPGTDFHAVSQNLISITPLNLDMTHYKAFEQVAGWVDGITKLYG